MGLITRVVDDAALSAEATEVAERLAAGATPALGRARNLLLASYGNSLEAHMEMEARGIAELSRTRYGREGVAAFAAKRKPDFS
jgi:2-(1,2-epoxy-1,2-dihydrophenyl)acetyl-CoA isomerase